jgi:hypothetical protein
MSKMIEINFSPDEKTLRQFGWIALVGFGFVAAIAWFEVLIFSFGLGAARPWVAGIFGGLGLLAALFSLVWPKGNKAIFVGLSVITFPIGFVLSYLVMGFLFYVLIAPVAIFFKLIGRDPMHRGYDLDAPSYWSEPRAKRPNADYFKQY